MLQGACENDNGFHADGCASGEGQIPLGRFHSMAHAWRQCPGQQQQDIISTYYLILLQIVHCSSAFRSSRKILSSRDTLQLKMTISEQERATVRLATQKPDRLFSIQEEQDKLMTLMDTGAALATASGVAGKKGSGEGEDPMAGLSEGAPGIVREAEGARASQEAFILSIASCTVHEERQDPTALTATPEQQRRAPRISALRIPSCAWHLKHVKRLTTGVPGLSSLLQCPAVVMTRNNIVAGLGLCPHPPR